MGATAGLPPSYEGGFSPGDSGGPFLTRDAQGSWTQSGVVSWTLTSGSADNPNIYAKITDSEIREWIDTVVFPQEDNSLLIIVLTICLVLFVVVMCYFCLKKNILGIQHGLKNLRFL